MRNRISALNRNYDVHESIRNDYRLHNKSVEKKTICITHIYSENTSLMKDN